MHTISKDYGKFLSNVEWSYFATIRPDYLLSDYSSDNMISRLVKSNKVEKVFFSLERDFNPSGAHAHVLIKSYSKLNRRKLAELLKTRAKTVTYFQEVQSIEDVIYYTTKRIGKNVLHYNYFDNQLTDI